MTKMNIVCFGFGQVAKNFIKKLNNDGVSFTLTTTSRENSKNKKIDNINYHSFQFTEKSFDKNFISRFEEADHILISIAPFNGGDIVVKNFQNYFKSKKIKWITYLSATSVYGDHKGPFQIFRLSGIYSNKYNILTRLKSGDAKIINKKNHFFSRIHVEDIANILCNSLNNFKNNEVYNISDDKPASAKEVAIIQLIPKSNNAQGACSLLEPHPKLSPATIISAWSQGCLFKTKSLFKLLFGSYLFS